VDKKSTNIFYVNIYNFFEMVKVKNSALDEVKAWLFPSIVGILGIIIWQDIKEIKSDIKSLIAQSNIDKTRIDNLERIIYKKQITSSVEKKSKDSGSNSLLVDLYTCVLLENRKKRLSPESREDLLG
jgi:hypothetical protein